MRSRFRQLLKEKSRADWIGFALFGAISIYAVAKSIGGGSPWLLVTCAHNCVIAFLFLLRRPSKNEDGRGLALALLALSWPTGSGGVAMTGFWSIPVFCGICLVFWALLSLGRSFGPAPADRGLVTRGPYRFVRHPMYLGELIYQGATLAVDFSIIRLGLVFGLVILQIMRIRREERLIAGYTEYARSTRWRLLPGIW